MMDNNEGQNPVASHEGELIIDLDDTPPLVTPPPGPSARNRKKRKQLSRQKQNEAPQPKKKREPSWVWDHYEKIEQAKGEDQNDQEAKCKHCGILSPCGMRSYGTTTMSSHLLRTCKGYKIWKAKQDKNQLKWVVEGGTQKAVLDKFDAKRVREDIAYMIIVDELPFKIVEYKGFKRLMERNLPMFLMPSRWSMMRDCVDIYVQEKEKFMSALSGHRISLTTDTWTSTQNMTYMVVTAHFIDSSWKLHKRIIAFKLVENHKGLTIAKELEDVMLDWEIEKVLTITVDNASANDNAIGILRNRLRRISTSGNEDVFILKGEFIHMRCMAHIINLIVQVGLSEIEDCIKNIRSLVKFVKSSSQREAAFMERAKKAKIESGKRLVLDVSTRWNSMYSMLSVAEPYQKAFEDLVEEYSNNDLCNPSTEEWGGNGYRRRGRRGGNQL